jgi:hypothetical protein
MTEKEFVIWLHGFLEISGAKTLDENQLQVIKDHLSTFFIKVTPERSAKKEDDIWGKKIKELEDMIKNTPPSTAPYYPLPNWPVAPEPYVPFNPYEITCSDSVAEPLPPQPKTYC